MNPADSPKAHGEAERRGAAARLRWVFFGSQGLRAGWGVLLFLLLLGAVEIAMALGLTGLGIGQATLGSARGTAVAEIQLLALPLIGVVLATAGMILIERRPLADYGLALRALPARLGEGAFWGLLLLSAVAGALVLMGALRLSASGQGTGAVIESGLMWAAACLMVALFEELAMRGYLLAKLTRGLGFPAAAVITALVFSAGHILNPGESTMGLISVVLVGLMFAYSVRRTGTLWWAVGFHAAWNWAQSYLFGVGNSGFASVGSLLVGKPQGPAWLSGGPTGPEGSVLSLLAIAAAAALLFLRRRSAATAGPASA